MIISPSDEASFDGEQHHAVNQLGSPPKRGSTFEKVTAQEGHIPKIQDR